ncbi:ABC transporter permease subunit [Sporosarcina highlanderae]|uniref:ABC transporter permease subunit n=1 Tax=Sporosarcina highlanderae TaxID=3035916 RepID=A0ABT8JLU9_9BACL|nr:ABC transporter permease subunit [Sporosarcina highlanderae]MDN4606115.1 ABC transporter permease subunit [Sporosarcina highlanderae]
MKNMMRFELKKSVSIRKNWFVFIALVFVFLLYFGSLNNVNQKQWALEERSLNEQIRLLNDSIRHEKSEVSTDAMSFQMEELKLFQKILSAHLSGDWKDKAAAEIEMLDLRINQSPEMVADEVRRVAEERVDFLTILLTDSIKPVYERTSVDGAHLLWNISLLFLPVLFYLLFFILVGDIYGYEQEGGTIRLLRSTPYSQLMIQSSKWIASLVLSMLYILITITIPFIIGSLTNGVGNFSYPIKVGGEWSTIGATLNLVWLLVLATLIFSICLIQFIAYFMKSGTFTIFLGMTLFLVFRFIPENLIPTNVLQWIPFYYFKVNILVDVGNDFFRQGMFCLSLASVALLVIPYVIPYIRNKTFWYRIT